MSSRTFFIAVILVALVLNALPYLLASTLTPPDREFTWTVFNPIDVNHYLSKMAQGADGSWLSFNRYNNETQDSSFNHFLYILLGKISGTLGIPDTLFFFASRIAFGTILLLTIALFLKRLPLTAELSRISFLLIVFGSGIGWVLGARSLSVDLWLPDATPIERFTDMPHFLLAHSLLILSLMFVLDYVRTRRASALGLSGLLAAVLGFVVPFHLPVVYLTVLISLVLISLSEKRSLLIHLRPFALFIVTSCPPLLYYLLQYLRNFQFRVIAEQNVVISPPIWAYLFGLGVVGFLALVGLFVVRHEKDGRWAVIVAWILSISALVYAPVIFQRRFFQTAAYVPIGVLAALGLSTLSRRASRPLLQRLIALILLLSLPSTLLVLQGIISKNPEASSLSYPKKTTIHLLEWIRHQIPGDSIILSSYQTGNLIPAFANRAVFIGHNVETPNFNLKYDAMVSFYFQMFDDQRARTFLLDNNIQYVMYSDIERGLGYRDPGEYVFLEKVFKDESVTIYSVH